ncbi:MAG: formyltransferase [Acidiferrobacter sp.]
MTTRSKIVVFAYHEVGYRCLEWLLTQGETVQAVFTHEDNPRERIWFRSVADLARTHKIPVFMPLSAKDDGVAAQVRTLGPDVVYSFYYRNMLPLSILTLPSRGAFNMHGSLLPRYRGRVPINWAIIRGERETGATLHHMVARADAGDIVDQEAVPIGPWDTAHDVFLKVTDAAVDVLARNHGAITAGHARRVPQDEAAVSTYGARRPEDGRIVWDQTAASVFNLVRALTDPYPGAFSEACGQTFYVWWGKPVQDPGGAPRRPGQVVSVDPLVIATGEGGFHIEKLEWADKEAHEHHNFVVGELVGP